MEKIVYGYKKGKSKYTNDLFFFLNVISIENSKILKYHIFPIKH